MQLLLRALAVGNQRPLGEPAKPATKPLLTVRILGVIALVAGSLAAIADQSDKFVSAHEIIGLHEIPSFVAKRVELTPGLAVDSSAEDAVPSPGGQTPPTDRPTENRMEQG